LIVGAGFKLTVKLEPENEQAETSEPTYSEHVLTQTLAGKTVLFAEDQLTIQMLTKNVLTKAGAEVTVASNGQLAMEAYSKACPDIVITDAMMPEMDGYELSVQLREAGYSGPIIAVTAATIGDERDRLIAAGADAVLSKPMNIDKLKLALADWEQNRG
jgi:CheY-like chemotaxis protein